MALEAGSVFVKLAALFSRDDFQKWDAAVDKARAKAKDPVEVKLDAKTTAAERKIAVVEELLKRYNKERVDATLDIDKRNFDRKIIEAQAQLKALRAEANKNPFASLAQDAERAGIHLDNLAKTSDNAGKKLNLLAPIFSGLGRVIRSTNADMDGFLGRLGRAASEAGRGGTGLGGLASSAVGAFGKLPWWLQASPALLPAGASVVGSAGALIGSAGAAAAGAGALGAGALGAGGVGLGALMAGFKPAEAELKDVQKAYDALTTAQQKYGENSKQAQTAQKNLNAVMKDSSPAFLQVVKDMKTFEEEWQSKTKPAVQAFGGIFADVFGQLQKHSGELARIVNGVAKDLQGALHPVIQQLFGREVMGNIANLASSFGSMLRPALDGVVKLFRAFLNVAVAMQPYLQALVARFDTWAGSVLKATQNHQKLQVLLDKLVSQFQSWMKLIEAVGRLMFTFFSGGAAQGQKMVDKLTQILDKWNAWLKANPEKLQKFFSDSTKLLGDIFKALGPIVALFAKLSVSLMPAFAKLLEAVSPVVNAILGALAGVVSWIAKLVSHNEALKIMLGTVLAMGAAWKAITFAGKITGITQLIGLFGKLKVAAGEAAVAEDLAGAGGGAGGAGGLLSRLGGLGGGRVGRFFGSTAVRGGLALAGGAIAVEVINSGFSQFYQQAQRGRTTSLQQATGIDPRTLEALNQTKNAQGWDIMSPVRTNMPFGASGQALISQANEALKNADPKKLAEVIKNAQALRTLFPQLAGPLNNFIQGLQGIDPAALKAHKALSSLKVDSAWNRSFQSAWQQIHNFTAGGGRDIKSLKDDFDTNMRRIESTVGLHTKAGATLMRNNVHQMVSYVQTGLADGTIKTRAGLAAINSALAQGVKIGAISWTERWKTMFSTLEDLYHKHKISVGTYMSDIDKLIREASKKTGDGWRDNMQRAFSDITDLMRHHKINTKAWSDEVKTIIVNGARKTKEDVNTQYTQTMNNLRQRLNDGTLHHRDFNREVAALNASRNRETHGSLTRFAAQFVAAYAATHHLSAPELKKLIARTNEGLRSLHAAPIRDLVIDEGKTPDPSSAVQKSLPAAARGGDLMAAGGLAPGREYGLDDHMTLVDPAGRPRAKMAGDEGILTRYQMPVVDKALSWAKRIGQSAYGSLQEVWNNVRRPHGYAQGGELPGYARGGQLPGYARGGAQGYLFPFVSGVNIGRTDQGVDASMPVGSPIGAIGDSTVVGHQANWYAGQPFMWWRLNNGPRAGRYVYLAEQITGLAPPGAHLTANQAAASYASSGTAIEMGWATAGGSTLAKATSGYTEGQVTPAGMDFHNFILGLAHGIITGGTYGFGAAPTWTPIKEPRVGGKSAFSAMVRASLHDVTTAANAYGEKIAASMGGVGSGGFTGSLSGPIEQQVFQFMSANGFNKVAIAGMLGNAVQESDMNPNAPGGGLWQQISNFSGGTGGSLLHQMQVMLPQIRSFQGALNSAGTPENAAAIFMNSFEKPNAQLANLARREQAARQAFNAGYRGGGLLDLLLPGFAGGGNVWRVRASAEDASSGSGWTELSTNGNAAARSGHPHTASHQGGWDFASLGRRYPRGTQLRITNFGNHRSGTFPETDVGDGSSFAPAVGLTPAVRAFLGFPTDPNWSGQVDIQLPHGDINLPSGFGRLIAGSGGGSSHNRPVDPLTRRERRELNRLTRQRNTAKHFNPAQEKRWEYLEKKAHHKLPKPHDPTRLQGLFQNIPDLTALDAIKTDYWDTWIAALEAQAGRISTIGGEADPYTGDPHLALLASGNPSDLALVNPRPDLLEDSYTDPVLGTIKIPTGWPQFSAGTNVVDAQMWDVAAEIILNQSKVAGLEQLTGPKLRDLNDTQGIIGQALLERKHRQMRIERVLAADLKLANHIKHRMTQIDNDLRAMSLGDAQHRLQAAIGADQRNARVQATRNSIDTLRQHKATLDGELKQEQATTHPDKNLVNSIRRQIAAVDTHIAREEAHLRALEQQPHSGTDTAYENLIKTTLRDEKKTLTDSLKPITDEMFALGGSRTSVGKKGTWGDIQNDMAKLRVYKQGFAATISDVQSQTIPDLQIRMRDLQSLKATQGIVDWSTLNKPEQQFMDVFDYWLAQIQGGIKPDGLQADDAATKALAAYLSGQSGGTASTSVGQIAAQLLQGKTPDGLIIEDQTVPASASGDGSATPEQDPTAWEGPFEVAVYKDMLAVWRQRMDEAKGSMGIPGGATYPQLTSIQGNINTLQDAIKQIMDGYAAQNTGASSGTASAADIAAAAYQDFLGLQNAQQQLFTQFGSNFVRQGADPFATQGGRDAGVRFYGAASGFARGGDMLRVLLEQQQPPGGGPISITNHFGGGPGDPHTWAASQRHEVMALMGRR